MIVTEDQIREEILETIQRNRIMLFMKGTPDAPRCGFSARTRPVPRRRRRRVRGHGHPARSAHPPAALGLFRLADDPAALHRRRAGRRLRHHQRALRDGRAAARWWHRLPSQTAAVVGAGVIGLSAARALREDGFAVTVYERDRVGIAAGLVPGPLAHLPAQLPRAGLRAPRAAGDRGVAAARRGPAAQHGPARVRLRDRAARRSDGRLRRGVPLARGRPRPARSSPRRTSPSRCCTTTWPAPSWPTTRCAGWRRALDVREGPARGRSPRARGGRGGGVPGLVARADVRPAAFAPDRAGDLLRRRARHAAVGDRPRRSPTGACTTA